MFAIGQLIQHTTTLKKLTLRLDERRYCIVPLAEALKYNSSVEELHCHPSHSNNGELQVDDTMDEVEAFLSTLQHHNLTLQKLTTANSPWEPWDVSDYAEDDEYDPESNLAHHIPFYLSLNQAGRGKLLGSERETATTEDWWGAIANQDDPSVIYFFLREKPSLCLPSDCIKMPKYLQRMQRFLANWLSTGSGRGSSSAVKGLPPSKRQRKSNARGI